MMSSKELTVTAFKKTLKNKNQKELADLLCRLYKECEPVRKIMNLELRGEEYADSIVEEYKKKLNKIFFPADIVRSGFSMKQAKGIVKEYLLLVGSGAASEMLRAEIYMFFVECGIEFTNAYGDIDDPFYAALEKAYAKVADIARVNDEVFEKYRNRLRQAVEDTEDIGWGFGYNLYDEYAGLLAERGEPDDLVEQ